MSAWLYVAALLLWTKSGGCMEKMNNSNLIEFIAADFYEKLYSGKMMFMYFECGGSPSISLFLVELEKAADVLEDYGVLVGKVNCNKEIVSKYCLEDKILQTAFLFRNGKEFLSFDLDTVFDVNAIVSEVLFAILRDEVRYVHTDADLLAMEKSVRGMKDIALGYVSSLGTQEHRSIMETAFVYGSKYQFILITGGPVLKHLGISSSSPSARVWVLHCRDHKALTSTKSGRCPLTRMRKLLSTLNLHSFLQLMDAPVLTETHEDPSKMPPQFPYKHVPQVFLFSHPETKDMDKETAHRLAWKLRGLAQMVLIHRGSLAVQTLKQYNVAYRLPGKSLEYLTLHSIEEVLDLFTNEDTENVVEREEEEEIEDFEDENIFDQLDDEVAASVYLKRGQELDMDVFTELNTQNFHSVVAQSSLTVALFYLKWDAVSMAFLEPFVEVAESLLDADIDDVQMCAVNCGEWTDLCAGQSGTPDPIPFQPITAFPAILILRPREPAQRYEGMLSSQALYRFILLSRVISPLELNDADIALFMSGAVHPDLPGDTVDKVLGLFDTHSHPGLSVFVETARALRGKLLTGLLTDGLALKRASDHKADLPAVLVFPSWRRDRSPSVLPLPSSAEELTADINTALLQPVPELTVATLPSVLSRGKTLLLLFVGEEEDEIGQKQNKALVGELKRVVEIGSTKMEKYLPCWIHLGRTPAGIDVLGSYLGSVPPLPSLILTHNPSAAEIYQYPPRHPITAASVLQWLRRVEQGREQAAGVLGEVSWPPVAPFYDFLAVMDKNDPSSARQQLPRQGREEEGEEETREEDGEVNGAETETVEETSVSKPTPGPNQHTEL
ncbi:thioredoxin domain-containing protein 16 [Eucyclogobius newberryi]|uniref:thioredoxin domain-containing protein 16 n=1 Tax=Eucyclogobius newberryi TaxID=166745 RepID=UPI003B58D22A